MSTHPDDPQARVFSDTVPEASSTPSLGWVPALDGLRGVAVLLVVAHHTPLLTNPFTGRIFNNFLDRFSWGGFLGVDMFFVLSGFLITTLLLQERFRSGRIGLTTFYRRRAARLLPALVVLLGVHYVYAAYIHLPSGPEFTTDWSAMLYVLNYKLTAHASSLAPSLTHLWTLSVEEQFYLVWPALLVGLLALRRRAVVPWAVIGAITLIAIRRAVLWHHGVVWTRLAWNTDTRADSLLVGALLAWFWIRGRVPKRMLAPAAWIGSATLVLAVACSHADSSWLFAGGFTLVAVASGLVILAVVNGEWRGTRVLELAPLRLTGRVSYGLYLWHPFVFYAVDKWGPHWDPAARVAVAYTLSAAATGASYVFVERPVIRWNSRVQARHLAPS